MRSVLLPATFLFAGALYGAAPTLVTTIPLNSGAVTGVAANSLTNKVYVVDEANGVTQILDGTTNAIVATVPFAAGGLPLYPAINKSRNQFVIAGGDTGAVYDGVSNGPVVNISANANIVGNSAFNSMALNENTNKLYSSTFGGVVMTDLSTAPMAAARRREMRNGQNLAALLIICP
jgi:DNA-binding beta-propeller fold protein YncE